MRKFILWARKDSNLRSSRYKLDALAAKLLALPIRYSHY